MTRRPPVAPLLLLLALAPSLASAGTARLLTTDAAEPLDQHVLGLQRTALALPGGFALDTALLADLGLVLNAGVRWAGAVDMHRFSAGVRYAHFVGKGTVNDFVTEREELVTRFEPEFSGPTVYATYGIALGKGLVQVEGRYSKYDVDIGTLIAGALVPFTEHFGLALEGGAQLIGRKTPRFGAGLRYAGPHLGFTLGAAYLNLEDPLLPDGKLRFLPVLDLSWSF